MDLFYPALTLLFAPATLLALVLYTLLTYLAEWSGAYFEQRCQAGSAPMLLLEHLYIPWFNLLALALFITLLFPQIFGIAELPESRSSIKRLADITLLISFVLPLIPVLGRSEIVLPLQGIIILTIIFGDVAEQLGAIDIDYWPGWSTIIWMISISLLTLFLSRLSSSCLGEWLDERLERRGFERALQHGIQLALQSPVIFIYAMGLGAQLK